MHMHTGMIGAHIQKHEIAVFAVPPHAPILRDEAQGVLFDFLKLIGQAEGSISVARA